MDLIRSNNCAVHLHQVLFAGYTETINVVGANHTYSIKRTKIISNNY